MKARALFASVQLLIATSFDQARVSCIGAGLEHYGRGKTVAGPDGTGSEDEVPAALGNQGLAEQERLIAGMLHELSTSLYEVVALSAEAMNSKDVKRFQDKIDEATESDLLPGLSSFRS